MTREHNERMSLAWHIEALHRTKRLPKLKTLMAKTATRRKQTWQEQMAVMDAWVTHTHRAATKQKRIAG